MKLLLTLLIAIASVQLIDAIVCLKNFCNNIKCPNWDDNEMKCNGRLEPKSSFCGCCTTCVTEIEPYGHCLNLRILNAAPAGNYYRHECKTGYKCIQSKCQP